MLRGCALSQGAAGRPAVVRKDVSRKNRVSLGRAIPHQRAALLRTSAKSPAGGSSDADTFLESPVGKFVSWLGNSVTASKLNEGKVKFAIMQAGDYDSEAVSQQMEDQINSEKVMVYSFSTCPFCVKAKALLDDLSVEYTAVELDQFDGGYAIRAELAKKTGRTSMPNIFIGGKGIGGCNDGPGIMTLNQEGKLVQMLQDAGAMKA